MDEATRAELSNVQAAIQRLETMIQRLIDKEESRISRISEIEIDIERLKGDCKGCRDSTHVRLTEGNLRFKDHEDRISSLEDPNTGAMLKGQIDKGRDSFMRWVEFGKAVAFLIGAAAVIVALFRK